MKRTFIPNRRSLPAQAEGGRKHIILQVIDGSSAGIGSINSFDLASKPRKG